MHKPLPNRRHCLQAAAALGASLLVPAALASDAAWPAKGQTLRIIVPFPAGGVTDVVTRQFAEQLTRALGVNAIVDNKPGAGGSLGMTALARSPADGYTLALTSMSALTLLPHVMKVDYDPVKDFSAVASVMYSPAYVLATPAFKGKSLDDVWAQAKASGKGVSVASSGYGTLGHIMIEQINRRSPAALLHVPYKGGSQLVTDAAGGQFELLVANPFGPIKALISEGKLRVLAVTGPERVASLAQIPTLTEAGYPEANLVSVFGFYAPTGTPQAVLKKLHEAINTILSSADMRDKLLAVDNVPDPTEQAQFQQLIQREWESNGQIIRAAGIKAQD